MHVCPFGPESETDRHTQRHTDDANTITPITDTGCKNVIPHSIPADLFETLHIQNFSIHIMFTPYKNERSSADSLFRKGNAKLYLFHFGQHLV